MARRRSSNSNNGGCLGAFLLVGLVVYLFQNYWPVILLVALIGFVIWAISRAAQNRNANNVTTPVSNQQFESLNRYHATGNGSMPASSGSSTPPPAPVVSQYSGTDPNICHEINRQITAILNRRRELTAQIDKTQKSIWKLNKSFGGLNQEKTQKRDALVEQKELLDGRLNAAVYTFRESESKSFTELKAAFSSFRDSNAKAYNGAPTHRSLLTTYIPVGDMKYIFFSAEPLCLTLGGDIFCLSPSYIVRFKKDGTYVTTYTCKALSARIENSSYSEQVTQYRWLYAKQDGGRDMRYSNNRQISYQTTKTHTVPNMLFLELAGASLQYDVEYSVRNKITAAIKAYNAVVPSKTYDSVYHVLRLLDACDTNNPNLRKLQNILNGEDNYIEYNDDTPESAASSLYQSVRNDDTSNTEERKRPSKAKRFFKGLLKVAVAGAAITAGVAYGPSVVEYFHNQGSTPSQTVVQPTARITVAPTVRPVQTIRVTLPTVAPTSVPIETKAQTEYTVLQSGGKGEEVERLKKQLVDLGYLNASWKGYYGPATIEAVKLFQQDAGLPVTGIADAETQAAIYSTTISNQAESEPESINSEPSEPTTVDNTPEPTAEPTPEVTPEPTPEAIGAPILAGMHGFEYAQGSRGDAIRYIQQMLIDQEYLAAGQADGVYGPKTEAAVKSFQEANGLPATGIVDLVTQFKLAELESGFAPVEGQSYEYAGLNRYGVYRFEGGVYIGLVKSDRSYQEGTLYYEDGTTYAGTFKNNQRSGKGEAWYPNGDYYVGNWQNDKMNGKGVYHFGSVDSTEQYDGEWVDGQMSGKGVYTMADGTTIKGKWENNQQVGWWK